MSDYAVAKRQSLLAGQRIEMIPFDWSLIRQAMAVHGSSVIFNVTAFVPLCALLRCSTDHAALNGLVDMYVVLLCGLY